MNGTIEYTGGNAGQIDYQKFRFNRDSFERELGKYFEGEMESHSKGKLNPKFEKAIVKLCEHYYVSPSGPDSPYPDTELYNHSNGFGEGGICPVIRRSFFFFITSRNNNESPKRNTSSIVKSRKERCRRDWQSNEKIYY